MWIRRVKLKNFGCHEEFEQKLERGLVGIFGPNGSGKSTIVDGIYYALTGDLGRFEGVKGDQIRIDAGDKDEAYIEVEAEHDGTKFKIRRGLRPNKQSLKVGDDEPVTKSGDIQDKLKELGVDAKLIGTYVFVSQWSMFDFISQTPGERAKTYQHLCNTGRAQEIVDAIDKLMDQDRGLSVELVDNSDEIRQEIDKLQFEYDNYRKEHAEAKKSKLADADHTLQQEIVDRRGVRNHARGEIKKWGDRLVEAKKELESCLLYTSPSPRDRG